MIDIVVNHNQYSLYSTESTDNEPQSLMLPVTRIHNTSGYVESQSDSPIYSRVSQNDIRRNRNCNLLIRDTTSTDSEDSRFGMSSSITTVSTIMIKILDRDESALSSTLAYDSEDSNDKLSSIDEGHLGIIGWNQIQQNKSSDFDLNQSSGYLALHSRLFDNSAIFKRKMTKSVGTIPDDSEDVGVPSEISVILKDINRTRSESFVTTLYPSVFNQKSVGFRLYSQAAKTALKLNKMREDAKRREEEETAFMFHPKLISKSLLTNTDDKEKVYNRLYEYSKRKKIRDSLNKANEIDQLKKQNCKVISIEQAAAFYERKMAQKRENEKKLSQLTELLTPTFAPKLITNTGRATHSKRDSFNRLYSANYLQEREDKLKRKKEKMNKENCTFRPIIIKSFSERSVLQNKSLDSGESIWDRLSRTCQLQDIQKGPNCKLKQYRSKSMISLNASSAKYEKGSTEYERLYSCRQPKSKYTPDPKMFEYSFQPKLCSKKSTKFRKGEPLIDRLHSLYKYGTNKLQERRSMQD